MSFRGWLWTGSGMNPGPFDGPTATRETSCRLSTRKARVDNLLRLHPVDLEYGQLMQLFVSSFLALLDGITCPHSRSRGHKRVTSVTDIPGRSDPMTRKLASALHALLDRHTSCIVDNRG